MTDNRSHIINVLRKHPDTTQESLANRLKVADRTVRRHLKKLIDEGRVLEKRDGRRKVYCLSPGQEIVPSLPSLTESEAEALTIASLAGLGALAPTPFADKIRRALDKLENTWVTEVFSFEPELESTVWSFESSSGPADNFDSQLFIALLNGVRHQRPVVAEYYSAYRRASSRNRKLHPLGFLLRDGSWMLAAYCCGSRMVKDFAVAGFRSAQLVEDETFDRPRDFDLHSHARNRFGAIAGEKTYDVLLRVSEEAAPYFQRKKYHPSQEIQSEHDNGPLTVRYRVDGLEDILAWIMSWGAKLKVVEPVELRELVVDAHKEAARRYGNE